MSGFNFDLEKFQRKYQEVQERNRRGVALAEELLQLLHTDDETEPKYMIKKRVDNDEYHILPVSETVPLCGREEIGPYVHSLHTGNESSMRKYAASDAIPPRQICAQCIGHLYSNQD